MEKQKNNEAIRYNNQLKLIELLKQESYTCIALARQTQLSNTAVVNIIDSLVEKGLVVSSSSKVRAVGRRPIKYRINADFGCVVSVELSDRDIVVCIANINKQILYCEKLPDILIITEDVINKIIQLIKDGLSSDALRDKKLLGICIASPGLIDPETGYYKMAYRIKNFSEINIIKIFEDNFACDVIIKKDVVAGLIGEMKYGVLSLEKPENAIFLHLDMNVGISFVFNGQVYEGNNGYIGEIGFYAQNNNEPNRGLGEFISLTAIMIAIKERIKKENIVHPFVGKDVISFDEIKFLFLSGDTVVEKAVRDAAKDLALFLLNLNYVLDVQRVVINGKIVEFGDKFLKYINHYIKKYDRELVEMNIGYSTLMNRSITLGCIGCIIDNQIEKVLKN